MLAVECEMSASCSELKKWIVCLSTAWLPRSYRHAISFGVYVFQKLKHTESDKLQVQIQAYLDNVFDVGALLEDAETKNAALERVEELEENMSHVRIHDDLFNCENPQNWLLGPLLFSCKRKYITVQHVSVIQNVDSTAKWQGHGSLSKTVIPACYHTVPSQHGIYYDLMLSLNCQSPGKTNRTHHIRTLPFLMFKTFKFSYFFSRKMNVKCFTFWLGWWSQWVHITA